MYCMPGGEICYTETGRFILVGAGLLLIVMSSGIFGFVLDRFSDALREGKALSFFGFDVVRLKHILKLRRVPVGGAFILLSLWAVYLMYAFYELSRR